MASSKKLLVPFDPKYPKKSSSDFLVPAIGGATGFFGLKSHKKHLLGIVIFVGNPVSHNDLFKTLVDSGEVIADVDGALADMERFVEQVGTFRIGNVIGWTEQSDRCAASPMLEVKAQIPSAYKAWN